MAHPSKPAAGAPASRKPKPQAPPLDALEDARRAAAHRFAKIAVQAPEAEPRAGQRMAIAMQDDIVRQRAARTGGVIPMVRAGALSGTGQAPYTVSVQLRVPGSAMAGASLRLNINDSQRSAELTLVLSDNALERTDAPPSALLVAHLPGGHT